MVLFFVVDDEGGDHVGACSTCFVSRRSRRSRRFSADLLISYRVLQFFISQKLISLIKNLRPFSVRSAQNKMTLIVLPQITQIAQIYRRAFLLILLCKQKSAKNLRVLRDLREKKMTLIFLPQIRTIAPNKANRIPLRFAN